MSVSYLSSRLTPKPECDPRSNDGCVTIRYPRAGPGAGPLVRAVHGGGEMKKVIGYGVFLLLVLLLTCPTPSEAGGRVFFSFNIPLWVGPGWWGQPYYSYPTPPVVIQQSPVVSQQPAPPPQAPTYWYYCQNPQGYYPYIRQCPTGWMQVVPPTTPPTP